MDNKAQDLMQQFMDMTRSNPEFLPRAQGDRAWRLYEQTKDAAQLDRAISKAREALDIWPEPRALRLVRDLGARLVARHLLTDNLDDLVSGCQYLVEAIEDGNALKAETLFKYGQALAARSARDDRPDERVESLLAIRAAVEQAEDDDPQKVVYLRLYAVTVDLRFEESCDIDDLNTAISVYRRLLELSPHKYPDQLQDLEWFFHAVERRYELTHELADLDDKIKIHQRALQLLPADHEALASRLCTLGNDFRVRFARADNFEDIESAILAYRRALELMPRDDPDDIMLMLLTNLGDSLHTHFMRSGNMDNLNCAISSLRRSVELMDDDHAKKPLALNILSESLLTRFEQLGDLQDMDTAFMALNHALELSPEHGAERWEYLTSLGSLLQRRHVRLGEDDDMMNSVAAFRKALEVTPDGDAAQSSGLINLAGSLCTLFWGTKDLDDLNGAISMLRRALELSPDDFQSRLHCLTNLGLAMSMRYDATGDLDDLESCITLYSESGIELLPDNHPRKPALQSSILATCLMKRFKHTRSDIKDLETAIELQRRGLEIIQESDSLKPGLHLQLALSLRVLFEQDGTQFNFDAAVHSYMAATTTIQGPANIRFDAAKRCASFLHENLEFSSPETLLSVHSRILDVLPEMVWLGYSVHRRYVESASRGFGELVNAAVSVAISADALSLAIEWLEAGRSLVWSQILALRTPADELAEHHPELAHSFGIAQQQLQQSHYIYPANSSSDFSPSGIPGIIATANTDEHRRLVMTYERILGEIRGCPGFEDFLHPKKFKSLVQSSSEPLNGPAIYINAHSARCDALIITPDGSIVLVPLPDLTLERAQKLRSLWVANLSHNGVIQRAVEQNNRLPGDIVHLLGFSWKRIVRPVLEALDLHALTNGDRLPHVTWCPTGPIAQFPLHAAGIYDEEYGPRVFDFVVSSYTPSLSSLFLASKGLVDHDRAIPKALIVTQPGTQGLTSWLPGTQVERIRIQQIFSQSHIESEVLDHEQATVASIRDAIDQYPWVHLSCHGVQHPADAIQSAFMLYDGTLSLSDLMKTTSQHAELAFLSACQTATGDKSVPEESVHLAAGMLAVGFKGVVATMWSIKDADAPEVVAVYYKKLIDLRNSGVLGKGETGAAYALHEAVEQLRKQVGEENFVRWVPFVHFGV